MNRAVRVILALSLPVTILLMFLLFTIIVSWGHGKNLCDTWMAWVLPYCRR
jgi:hypothetical protein